MKEREPKLQASAPSDKLVVLPYVNGLSEVSAHVLKKYDMTMVFSPANTIGQQLFKLKEKANHLKMSDTVYKVGCKHCDKYYIGETTRPLYVQQKEHQAEREKATNSRTFTCQHRKDSSTIEFKSALAEHTAMTNHIKDWDGVKTLDCVSDWNMHNI